MLSSLGRRASLLRVVVGGIIQDTRVNRPTVAK